MVKILIKCNGIDSGTIEVMDYNNDSLEDLTWCYDDDIYAILEDTWSSDISDSPYYEDVPPQGVFGEYDFLVNYHSAAELFLQNHKGEAILTDNDKVIDHIDLSEHITELIRRKCGIDGDELNCQICGLNIVRSLDKFIHEGKWHIGLIDENDSILTDLSLWPKPIVENEKVIWRSSNGKEFEPIIWFGLDNEPPIECWTLSRDCNYLTALSDGVDFPYYNWEVLLDNLGNVAFWTFEELSESGPNPIHLINECPIMLHVDDVTEYVMSIQKGIPLPEYNMPRFRIENGVFKNYKGHFKEIYVPNGVSVIDIAAFAEQDIEKVYLPEGLEEISVDAFSNCKLLKSVKLPESIKIIASGAFENCELLGNINLPDNLQELGLYSFNGCLSLQSIRIPHLITRLRYGLFMNCKSLKTVYIPNECNADDALSDLLDNNVQVIRY